MRPAMPPAERAERSTKMKAFWADPEKAAGRRAAMRLVSPEAAAAILADVVARPKEPLKVLAFEHDVSESTIGLIARSNGIYRKPRRSSLTKDQQMGGSRRPARRAA